MQDAGRDQLLRGIIKIIDLEKLKEISWNATTHWREETPQ